VSSVVTQASAAIAARTGVAPSREVLSVEARQIVEHKKQVRNHKHPQ
jgi:hypothetical protein